MNSLRMSGHLHTESPTDVNALLADGILHYQNLQRLWQKKYRVIQNDCRAKIVQWQFRTKFGKQPTSDNSIRRWYAQFQDTVCVCIQELKVRIRTAIQTITADMLQTVGNELDYRVDVCIITKGAHIEHL